MIYRKAVFNEIDQLAEIRKRQLIDEGIKPTVDIDDELLAFFRDKLTDGSMIEWVAEDKGKIIATAAVIFYNFPPTYTNKTGLRGYITNMYTHDDYRRQGIATTLLHKLRDDAVSRGIKKLWLGASKSGRPVYEKFGFKDTKVWLDLEINP